MSAFFLDHPKETDLALFAGGESGPFARWRIERHVERCPRCQEITADFFRLPDQLNGLADLPSVDWKQMAMAIETGVRADAGLARPARRSGFPPLMWQAGLVAATVVVVVVVVRRADQPQPEPALVAVAEIQAPASSPVAQESAPQADEMDVAASAPTTTPAVEPAPLAKATAERQTFASDIAAPAAPPPPTVFREVAGRRVESAAQPVGVAAESAEARLRSDAATRVGAVSAFGGAAQAAADQAGVFRQARVAWAQLPVDAVNFDDAPVGLSGAYAASAGAIVKTPSVTAQNRSERTVTGLVLVWTAGDADAAATAMIQRQGISIAPGDVLASGGERSWRLPTGIVSATMRIYLSRVSFDDGMIWSPTAAQIASRGLIEPGAGYPGLELLPVVIERDDRP